MKYIDADKLRAEIRRLYSEDSDRHIVRTSLEALSNLMDFLDTLEEPVSDDLEKAAETKYPTRWKKYPNDGIVRSEEYFDINAEKRDAFKAGAEWQKDKMMEGAVECELYWDGDFLAIDLNMRELGYTEHDKVRIIIVKEDEE